MTEIILESTITCPHCGAKSKEEMPMDACVHFWACPDCRAIVAPLPGDCCVFCSFGSVPCPPMQAGDRTCS